MNQLALPSTYYKPLGGSSISRLNGTNYATWKFQMKRILVNRKLTCVVYDSEPVIDENDVAAREIYRSEYNEKDAEAQEIISSGLEQNIVSKILCCQSAREIWLRLQQFYEQEGDSNLEANIVQFCSIKMESDEVVADYIGRIEELVDKIRCYR